MYQTEVSDRQGPPKASCSLHLTSLAQREAVNASQAFQRSPDKGPNMLLPSYKNTSFTLSGRMGIAGAESGPRRKVSGGTASKEIFPGPPSRQPVGSRYLPGKKSCLGSCRGRQL